MQNQNINKYYVVVAIICLRLFCTLNLSVFAVNLQCSAFLSDNILALATPHQWFQAEQIYIRRICYIFLYMAWVIPKCRNALVFAKIRPCGSAKASEIYATLQIQKPLPVAPWRGVMNATQFPPYCYQRDTNYLKKIGFFQNGRMSENCLYLNVFAPLQKQSETYPIIVYVHGGRFQNGGSADYQEGPILDNFVSKDVVFVTFNYRLGPFGFLASGDDLVPGNNGLWDILEVLKWTKENGRYFGGDSSKITLMGYGAGAAGSSLIALSDQNTDLVHRVILMNGSPFIENLVGKRALRATQDLGQNLDCQAPNTTALLACLREEQPDIIIQNSGYFFGMEYQEWLPVVEKGHGKRIISQSLAAMVNQSVSTHSQIPILLGEFFYDPLEMLTLNDPVVKFADAYSALANPTYLYHFHYTVSLTEKQKDRLEEVGGYHGYDLALLFGLKELHLPEGPKTKEEQMDRNVTEIYSELLTNFAKYGSPTPPESKLLNWTLYDSGKKNYMSINTDPSMQSILLHS